MHHEEVELFLALFLVDGREQHAVALDAHHGPRGEVCDGDQRLSDELFGLIEGVDAGKDGAGLSGAVVELNFPPLSKSCPLWKKFPERAAFSFHTGRNIWLCSACTTYL